MQEQLTSYLIQIEKGSPNRHIPFPTDEDDLGVALIGSGDAADHALEGTMAALFDPHRHPDWQGLRLLLRKLSAGALRCTTACCLLVLAQGLEILIRDRPSPIVRHPDRELVVVGATSAGPPPFLEAAR